MFIVLVVNALENLEASLRETYVPSLITDKLPIDFVLV